MLIGRNYEREQLLNLCKKDESQFCAVYGRRRVGKTFLIRETFNNQFAFTHTGSYGLPREEQLDEFRVSLKKYGLKTSTLYYDNLFRYYAQCIRKSDSIASNA
jgi:hypothetical protein